MGQLLNTTEEIQIDINEGLDNQPKVNSVYSDLRFQSTRVRLGALNKPDFDYTDIGLLFPQNDTDEIIYGINQFPHSYKLGTSIEPHIHYIQTSADITKTIPLVFGKDEDGNDITKTYEEYFLIFEVDSVKYLYCLATNEDKTQFRPFDPESLLILANDLGIDNVLTKSEFNVFYKEYNESKEVE